MHEPEPQVFAPPAWLRFINIPAALLLAALVVVPVAQTLPVGASAAIVLFAGGASLCLGVRGARSSVLLTRDALIYRGVLRDRRIPIANVVDYRYDAGAWWWFVSVPLIDWIDGEGRRKRARLWCFAVDNRRDFGATAVQVAAGRLGVSLRRRRGLSA
jgi:hypothetical protein